MMTEDRLQKMRACVPLLPPPGGSVVEECLDEIVRLRAILGEADAYLETNPLTNIAYGSALHRKFKLP